ncbi:hypothetical protein ACX80W_12165 [Arthrobacter sp. TMN-37]
MTLYAKMKKQEAAAALAEFLDERPQALEHLIQLLAERSEDIVNLDGTVESLIPLWRRVKPLWTVRTVETGQPDALAVHSWLRFQLGMEPTLSPESIAIIDGVTSYLCRVVEHEAPGAQWRLGYHRLGSFMWQNYPVLARDGEEVALAHLLPGLARGLAEGLFSSDDDELAQMAAASIEQLNGTSEDAAGGDEPLVEVEDLGEDALRRRELEASLREGIAHEHSRVVDRMAQTLAKEDGITGVGREDREVLLVATPVWTIDQLQEWVTGYFEAKLSD